MKKDKKTLFSIYQETKERDILKYVGECDESARICLRKFSSSSIPKIDNVFKEDNEYIYIHESIV